MAGPGKKYKDHDTGKVKSYEQLRKAGATDQDIQDMLTQRYISETNDEPTPDEGAPAVADQKKKDVGSASSGSSSTPGSPSVSDTQMQWMQDNTFENRTKLPEGLPNAPTAGTQAAPVANTPAPEPEQPAQPSGRDQRFKSLTDFGTQPALQLPSRVARKVGMPENAFALNAAPLGGMVAPKETTDQKLKELQDRYYKGEMTDEDAALVYASATGKYDKAKAADLKRELNYFAQHPESVLLEEARERLGVDIDANDKIPFSDFPLKGALPIQPGAVADTRAKRQSILDGNEKTFGEYASKRISELTEQLTDATNRSQIQVNNAATASVYQNAAVERDRLQRELNEVKDAIDTIAAVKFGVDGDPERTAQNYNKYIRPQKYAEQQRYVKEGLTVPELDRFNNDRTGRELLLRKNRIEAEGLQDYVIDRSKGVEESARDIDTQIALAQNQIDYNGPDLNNFVTKLDEAQEAKYQQWKQQLPENLQNEENYDLRGLYKENPDVKPSENLHLTDKYKLPNHPTFSDESVYFNKDTRDYAGRWSKKGDNWVYTPYNADVKQKIVEGPDGKIQNVDALFNRRQELFDKYNTDAKLARYKQLEDEYKKGLIEYATLSDKYPEQRRREITRAIGETIYADASPIEKLLHVEVTDERLKAAAKKLGIDYNEVKDISDREFAGGGLLDAFYAGMIRRPAAQLEAFARRTFRSSRDQKVRDITDIGNAQILQEAEDESKIADEARMFGSPTKINFNADDISYLREIRNFEYGKDNNINWNSSLTTIGDVTGQAMSYAVLSKGIGGGIRGAAAFAGEAAGAGRVANVANRIAMNANRANNIGTFVSGYVSSYESNYQAARDFLPDDATRTMFAAIQSAKTAATELILPDYKLLDRMTGHAAIRASLKEYAQIVADKGVKGLTKSQLKSFVKRTVAPTLASVIKTDAEETLEEELDLIGDVTVNSLFGKDQSDRDVIQEAKQTAVITALGTTPLGFAGAGGQASRLRKDAFYEAGLNPEWFKMHINNRVNDGKMKASEAERSIETINAMHEIIKGLPQSNPNTGRRFTEEEKVDLAYNRLREFHLKKDKAATNDEVLSEQIDKAVKDLQQERRDIYEKQPAAATAPAEQTPAAATTTAAAPQAYDTTILPEDDHNTKEHKRRVQRSRDEVMAVQELSKYGTTPATAQKGFESARQSVTDQAEKDRLNVVADYLQDWVQDNPEQSFESLGKLADEKLNDANKVTENIAASRHAERVEPYDYDAKKSKKLAAIEKSGTRIKREDYKSDEKYIDFFEKTREQVLGDVQGGESKASIVKKYTNDQLEGDALDASFDRLLRRNLIDPSIYSPKIDNDAIQKQSTEGVPVREQTGGSEEVSKGNAEGQEAAATSKEEVKQPTVTWDSVMKVGNTIEVNGRKETITKLEDKEDGTQVYGRNGSIAFVPNEDKGDHYLLYQNGKPDDDPVEKYVAPPQAQSPQSEKPTRFGMPEENFKRNAFSLYNEYQDHITAPGADEELALYDQQMLTAIDSHARSMGKKLKPAALEKIAAQVMGAVYDDAGIQSNEDKTLQQIIEEKINNYSPKKQNNEEDSERRRRGMRRGLQDNAVTPETKTEKPAETVEQSAPPVAPDFMNVKLVPKYAKKKLIINNVQDVMEHPNWNVIDEADRDLITSFFDMRGEFAPTDIERDSMLFYHVNYDDNGGIKGVHNIMFGKELDRSRDKINKAMEYMAERLAGEQAQQEDETEPQTTPQGETAQEPTAPAEENAPAPEVVSEVAPAPAETEEERLERELVEKLHKFRNAIKKTYITSGGINPEIIEAGGELMAAYAKKGIYKIKQIVAKMVEIFGKEFFADPNNADAVKGVYAFYRQTNREARKQMDSDDAVDTFFEDELPVILTQENPNFNTQSDEQQGANITRTTSQGPEGTTEGGPQTVLQATPEQRESGRVAEGEGGEVLSTDTGAGTTGDALQPGQRTGVASVHGDTESDVNVNTGNRHPGLPVISPKREGKNYSIPLDFSHGTTFSPSQKYRDNIAAMRVLAELMESNEVATLEQQQVLAKYVGFGGLKQILLDPNRDYPWAAPSDAPFRKYVQEVHEVAKQLENLGIENPIGGITASVLNAHYTAIPIIRGIYYALEKAGFNGGKVLEPSAGIGNFIGAMPHTMMEKSTIAAVEKDGITGNILKRLYPEAKTFVGGYEDAKIPSNYVDVIISNIPFGNDIKIFDPTFSSSKKSAERQSLGAVHNYFFAKALSQVREGGIIAFVTSRGVLDTPGNLFLRKHIAESAEFLGAIRLPNTAFQVNANTEVVTDIIFLRKFKEGESGQQHKFFETKEVQAKHKDNGNTYTVEYNEYFHDHPENMFGKVAAGGLYRADEFFLLGKNKTEDFESRIREAADRIFPDKVYTASTARATDPNELKRYYIDKTKGVRVGNVIQENGKLVRIVEDSVNGHQVEELPKSTKRQKVLDFIKLRDSLNELFAAEINDEPEAKVKKLRDALNKNYDAFVKAHKNLQHRENGSLLSLDIDGFNVRALERVNKETGALEKADIFTRRTIKPFKTIEKADNLNDAIVVSLNEYGRVDMDRLTQLLGKTPPEVIADSEGLLYELPEGGLATADAYLSGNVKKKLALARAAAEVDPKFNYNVQALEKVIPADIPASQIEARIGARWIDNHYYAQFGSELFQTPIIVKYLGGTDQYKVNIDGRSTVEFESWGVKWDKVWRLDGTDIMKAALIGRQPVVKDKVVIDGKEKDVVNEKATEIAVQKFNEMKTKFSDWIWQDTDRREKLSRKYNDIFNTTIKRTYDGSFLSFSGLTGVELMKHQKDGVWMLAQNNGGIIDHIVGSGKTFIIVTAAMEMKRMGIVKKPMIIALKANAKAIANDFQKLYPLARVLSPKENDFTPAKRKGLLAQIANNDWDAIVITHDNYGKIPQSSEMASTMIQEEIEALEQDIDALKKDGEDLNKMQLKSLEKRKLNLITKLRELLNTPRDTEMRDFQDLGVDHIFLDESQEFKNLEYSTRLQGIAGLGSPTGSRKAFNMLLGIRTMQNLYRADKGVTFLSGTPISNTLVEMYLLLKYLRPRKMEELGMKTFDQWRTTFAMNYSDVEFGVVGALAQKNRFREFVNIPELSILYNEIADVRNDDNLDPPLDKPKIKGGKPTLVTIEQSPEQKEYSAALIEFVRSKGDKWQGLGLGQLTEEQRSAFGLIATGLSSKMAIDMRLIFPHYPDNPTGKLAKAADTIFENWRNSSPNKGTQLVFSDIGTPKSGNAREDLYDYLQESGVNDDDMQTIFGTGETMPEMKVIKQRMMEVLELTAEQVEKQIVDSKGSAGAFNIYDDIKKKLVQRGIPAQEIDFIHNYKTALAKEDLFRRVRAGEVRVLLGSTRKLGTGVNVQDRIVAMHHIDVPWRPSDMEQRDGRGIRQGNWLAKKFNNNEVEIYRYGTVLTLDAYKYQLIDTKQRFINQVKEGAVGERTATEEDGEDLGMNEIISALSGNPDILLKAKLEKKVQTLDRQRRNHDQDRFDSQHKAEKRQQDIDRRRRWLAEMKPDIDMLQEKFGGEEGLRNAPADIVIGGVAYPNKFKEAGLRIAEMKQEIKKKPIGTKQQIGTIYGMPIIVESDLLTQFGGATISKASVYVSGDKRQYQAANAEDPIWISRYIKEAVQKIFKDKEVYEREIELYSNDIPKLLEKQNTPFPKMQDLEDSRKQLAEVQSRLRESTREGKAVLNKPFRDSNTNSGKRFIIREKMNGFYRVESYQVDGTGGVQETMLPVGQVDDMFENGQVEYVETEEAPTQLPPSQQALPAPQTSNDDDVDIDEEIEKGKNDLRSKFGNQLGLGAPLNALPELTNLAVLYIRKGLKTAAQFAKAVGAKLNRVIVAAWNAAKQHWKDSQNMGVIPPSMRRYMAMGTGGSGGNAGNSGIPSGANTGTPGTGTAPAGTAAAVKTSKFMLGQKRAEALKRGMDMLDLLQETMFGAADIKNDQLNISPTLLGRIEKLPAALQDLTIGALSRVTSKAMKGAVTTALESQNKAFQEIGSAINNVFSNLGKSTEAINAGEKFAGETKSRWISDAIKISEKLREMVKGSKASLERVDRVLDPGFYTELSEDEFKTALKVELGDAAVDKMSAQTITDRYNEYRNKMGFDDPNYVLPTYQTLTPEEKLLHDTIRAMYDMMHEINFGIGKLTEETYEENKGVYSARLYGYFEIPKEARDAMKNHPSKLDESLYMERGDLTEWKLLNRLTDPIYSVTKRLYQTMSNKAILDYAEFIDKNMPDAVSKGAKEGYKRLGWGYGVLSNRYVRNDIAEDFVGHFFADGIMQKMYDYLRAYDRLPIRQFFKKLYTVYNPGTHLGNLTGNYVFAMLTGINPIRLTANVGWARKQAQEYSAEYRYALSNGLLQSEMTSEDHKNAVDDLNKLLQNIPDNWWVYTQSEKAKKIYRATDDIYKLAAFKSLLEMGYSPKDALDQVKDGFQNYHRVGKAYDVFSKVPLIGNPFGKFSGDLLRIIRKGVTERPLHMAAFLASYRLMTLLASYLSGEDERRRKIREKRVGVPKIPLPEVLGGDIPLAIKMGDKEWNVARFMSPMFVYGSADDEDAFEFFQRLSPQQIEIPEYTKNPNGWGAVFMARNSNDPVLAPLAQLVFNSDFRGVPVFDPKQDIYRASTLTDQERGANALRFVLRQYVPYYTLADDSDAALNNEPDYYGRDRKWWQVMVNFVGPKITEFPDTRYGELLKTRLDSYGYQYKREVAAIKAITKERANNAITQEQYEKRLAPHLERQMEIVQKARKDFEDLKGSVGSMPLTNYDPSASHAKPKKKKGGINISLPKISVPKIKQ